MATPGFSNTTELKADPSAQRSAAAAPKLRAQASPVMQAMFRLQQTVGNRGMHRLLSPQAAGVVQRMCAECEEEEEKAVAQPVQAKANEAAAGLAGSHASSRPSASGLPGSLRAGLEQLSGFDLSGVRVHTNSPRPAEIDALAYAQGTDIHLAPGQEQHLPHEGWHIVQQMQGRVAATRQAKGDVSLNDDQELEQEADSMGAQAQQLGDESAAAFHTGMTLDGRVLDDRPYATPFAGARAGIVQRKATFTAGPVTATTNLATHLLGGNFDAGFTPPTLNGATILSTANARAAIDKPRLGGRCNVDGTDEVWLEGMPTNTGSFTMQLPTNGPWSTTTPKVNVAALFAALGAAPPAACTGAGNTTFTVNGKPTDADFAKNVRTHENLHAADHKKGFTDVIAAWDTTLRGLFGKTFKANSYAAAEAAFWTAAGGTPNDIADKQHNKWIALNNATHTGTTVVTGGPASASNPAINPTCTISSLDVS